VAALALALLAPAARRAWSWRTLVVAVPFAATIILYTLANRTTTAANAIFLQDTAPLYVLLLGPWLLGEHVTRRDLWSALLIGAGLVLMFAGTALPVVTAPDPVRGNVIATVAGITWALTLMGLRWLAARPQGGADALLAGALAGNALAALSAAFFAFPVAHASVMDGLFVAYLGVFQIACAYLLMSRAMPRLPAFEVSLLLLVEPVLAPVWAWLLLGEPTGPLAIAGGAAIMGATALRAWQSSGGGKS
jgi:drug/metabolite transporter (DMT)-like permease